MKKRNSKSVILLVALFASLLLSDLHYAVSDSPDLTVEASTQQYQTTANLNMRTGASTKHKIILTIPKGQTVQYISKSGSWFSVRYNGKTGLVHSSYLKKITASPPEKKPTVKASAPASQKKVEYQTTANLNLRAGASTKHKIILTIPKGRNVEYLSKSGSWFRVRYNGKTGFVSSSYLKQVNAPKATPKAEVKPKYVNGVLLVNKKYGLPASFAPGENREARAAFNKMAAAAAKDGVKLTAFSTYRSFDYQRTLYNNYVKKDGQKAADRYSARPGHSEHQTGLAFDVSQTGAKNRFAESPATNWMAKHAHKYGFIVRYPKGKEHITGYMYEPWHLRYLGVDLATKVYTSRLTLEEYLGVK